MRKVKEAILTLEIEKKYTKDEILEKYLNEIYFGSGAYGIKTAARVFFKKDVSELSLAESAMLAGMPNRPNKYNPRKNLKASLGRAHLVLNQMKKFGFIDKEQYEEAMSYEFKVDEDIKRGEKLSPKTIIINTESTKRAYKAPEFTDIVTSKLFGMYSEEEIYEGGLKIYTTMDIEMQKAAQESFENYSYLLNSSELNGAMITIDSSNGYVKSIIGGKDYISGNFNRATMAKRQPGSSFKPFVYFTALNKGYQMNEVVEDSEVKFGSWEPQNYGENFVGNITVLEGMEKSINIVAIKLLQKIGIKNVADIARKAGIESEIPNNLTAALGTMSTSPFELASAYLPFSNGGYRVKPVFITKIEDRYGRVIYENVIEKEKIFDSNKVALIVHMLKNVVQNGSGRGARVKDMAGKYIEQGGKTGTTNEGRSAWFAGVTPEQVTVLYLGYDDNRATGRGFTGGGVAAPLYGSYYQRLLDRGIYTPGKFEFLEDAVKNGELVYKEIDSRTGLLADGGSEHRRWALFERGYEPVEKSSKYKFGLDKFFKSDREAEVEDLEEREKREEDVEQNKRNLEADEIFNELF
jgi:penicillin-binding protein 1A